MSPQEATSELEGLADDVAVLTGCTVARARGVVTSFVSVGAYALLDEVDPAGVDALRNALVEQAAVLVRQIPA